MNRSDFTTLLHMGPIVISSVPNNPTEGYFIMAHGLSLVMRYIERSTPEVVTGRTKEGTGIFSSYRTHTVTGPSRDRSLPGKKRIRARRA